METKASPFCSFTFWMAAMVRPKPGAWSCACCKGRPGPCSALPGRHSDRELDHKWGSGTRTCVHMGAVTGGGLVSCTSCFCNSAWFLFVFRLRHLRLVCILFLKIYVGESQVFICWVVAIRSRGWLGSGTQELLSGLLHVGDGGPGTRAAFCFPPAVGSKRSTHGCWHHGAAHTVAATLAVSVHFKRKAALLSAPHMGSTAGAGSWQSQAAPSASLMWVLTAALLAHPRTLVGLPWTLSSWDRCLAVRRWFVSSG